MIEALCGERNPNIIWLNRHFPVATVQNQYSPSLLSHLNHLYVEPNQILLIHLMALKLLDNVPEGIRAGLNEYKEFIAEIIAQSGRAMVRTLERRESAVAKKVLINDWTQFRKDDIGITPIVIRVNGDMYSKFLRCRLMNRGGKPLSPTGLPQVIHSIFTKLCNDRRLRAWYKFRTLSDAIGICGVQ